MEEKSVLSPSADSRHAVPAVAKKPKAPKRGKRYAQARALIDRSREYAIGEALQLVKATSKTKFDATIEVHCRLGIDPKRAEQTVRFSLLLPHSIGKKRKIVVFTTPAHEKEAKEAGADLVGGDELVKEIQKTGKTDFAIAVATPDFMKNLASVARILGQRGLMPSPKNETITTNVAKTIQELAGGKQNFRSDESGNLHAVIGKVSMVDEQLTANFASFVTAVKRAKPADAKGTYLRSVTVTSTMGPGIRVKA